MSNDIQGRIMPAKAFEKILRPMESYDMPIKTRKYNAD
jgi:hypothetical protein